MHRLNGELFHLPDEQPRSVTPGRGRLTDDGPDSRLDFEQTLSRQLPDYLLCCVGVDLHGPGQGTDRRESVARAQPATEYGFLGGENHLVRDGNAGLRNQVKWNHMCNISLVTVKINSFL